MLGLLMKSAIFLLNNFLHWNLTVQSVSGSTKCNFIDLEAPIILCRWEDFQHEGCFLEVMSGY